MSVMVPAVAPAEADPDADRPAPAGSPVFFQYLVFFIHYGEAEGLARRKAADFHFGQDIGLASRYTVDPLLPLIVGINPEGILVEAGQRQVIGDVAGNPDQHFAYAVQGYLSVSRINLNLSTFSSSFSVVPSSSSARFSPGMRRKMQLSSLASRKSPAVSEVPGRNAFT